MIRTLLVSFLFFSMVQLQAQNPMFAWTKQINEMSWSGGLDFQYANNISTSLMVGKSFNTGQFMEDGFAAQVEMIFKDDRLYQNVYSLRLGGYLTRKHIYFGYQLGAFTNTQSIGLSFIPKVGLGYKYVYLTYNRNFKLINGTIPQLYNNNFGITFIAPLHKVQSNMKNLVELSK